MGCRLQLHPKSRLASHTRPARPQRNARQTSATSPRAASVAAPNKPARLHAASEASTHSNQTSEASPKAPRPARPPINCPPLHQSKGNRNYQNVRQVPFVQHSKLHGLQAQLHPNKPARLRTVSKSSTHTTQTSKVSSKPSDQQGLLETTRPARFPRNHPTSKVSSNLPDQQDLL
jgi:hypothetical protein